MTEVLSGRVPIGLPNTLSAKPLIDDGRFRALAVTGAKRAEGLPNIPTVAEAGVPGYEALQWYGMLAPAGTPADLVARLQAEVAAALNRPEVQERLAADGAEAVGSKPAAFAKLIEDELAKWANVARAANIQPQ